ncbi:MAG: HPF/RaiA family ribosome-associated protein [bacterium]
MMNIQIKYTNIEPSESVEKYINDKIGSLEKLFKGLITTDPNFPEPVPAWVEVGKPNLHHEKGNIWYAECQIELPRKILRIARESFNVFAAIDSVKDEMKQLITDYKERVEDKRQKEISE